MLTVNHFEIIRRKVLLDGQSQRDVAKELGHSRKTIAKALEHPDPPGYRMSKARVSPLMDRFRPLIEQWMESDKTAPRKQRHTAQRMYERLRDEQRFAGGDGTVRRFVAKLKAEQPKEAFMPLVFDAGEEGQVDWGEAKVIENGTQRTVQLFCMRLSHSKASFVYPYERSTMEAFLEGHVRAFEFFGGVPRRLAYDNLKSAVTHVGRGRERQLNERFVKLRSFYLFVGRFDRRGTVLVDRLGLGHRHARAPFFDRRTVGLFGDVRVDAFFADLGHRGVGRRNLHSYKLVRINTPSRLSPSRFG